VREWLPTARPPVTKVAVPPESVLVCSAVVPSMKVTVPVGVPVPGEMTDMSAVSVIS
jgi:hypothetical protein